MTRRTLDKGERVTTPLGLGTVAYVRMSALSGFTEAQSVSVVLDARRDDAGYGGTTFAASDVGRAADEAVVYCCSACGCTDVEEEMWVALNSLRQDADGATIGDVISSCESGQVFCQECQEHHRPCLAVVATGICKWHDEKLNLHPARVSRSEAADA